MSLTLHKPPMTDEKTCDWSQITDRASAMAALRGTISIISFELTEKDLNLNRIDALAESILQGTACVDRLTPKGAIDD